MDNPRLVSWPRWDFSVPPDLLAVRLLVASLEEMNDPAGLGAWDPIAPSHVILDTNMGGLRAAPVTVPLQLIASNLSAVPMLSPDEASRAQRLRDPRDRQTFICAHALLRSLLVAQGVSVETAKAEFTKGYFGKPRLPGDSPLHFSLSYRRGWIAIAMASSPVGVDIELITPDVDALGIAERFFHPEEAALLRNFQGDELAGTFFRIWTRKEALVKAAGLGVDYMAATPAIKSPVVLPDETGAKAAYHVQQLACAADVALAVAIRLPITTPEPHGLHQ